MQVAYGDQRDSGLNDPEAPDPSDIDADVDDDTEPCPHCGRVIHEQSDFCPHCGQYISLEDAPISKRLWIVLAAVVCIIIVLLWLAQGM
jgi:uncharacterized membrane protein YvbJ